MDMDMDIDYLLFIIYYLLCNIYYLRVKPGHWFELSSVMSQTSQISETTQTSQQITQENTHLAVRLHPPSYVIRVERVPLPVSVVTVTPVISVTSVTSNDRFTSTGFKNPMTRSSKLS